MFLSVREWVLVESLASKVEKFFQFTCLSNDIGDDFMGELENSRSIVL